MKLVLRVIATHIDATPTYSTANNIQPIVSTILPPSTSAMRAIALKVAERALFLWNNDHIENLIKQNRKVNLPIIFPTLEKNARNHWNQAVQSLTLNVQKIFSDADSELFEECLLKYQEDEAQEEEIKIKREATSKQSKDIAAVKVSSNEPVLVPHRVSTSPLSG
ncbi:unnamed protein product [Fraxinus pennsylvanica]|uniref:Uncharacterized protein n=1 Tax=Fraxinus pennsylvanica TaxID=56036 RepID=A0AAD1ZBH3_9LAMI|nr:unnamed protein product [Fraxinus pennsylvanica]